MTVLAHMNETWIIIRLKKHRYLRALKHVHFETVQNSVGRCCSCRGLHTFVYSVSMCDWRCLVVAWRRCCCVFCLITAGSNYHTATTPPPAATSHGVNHPVNTRIHTQDRRCQRHFAIIPLVERWFAGSLLTNACICVPQNAVDTFPVDLREEKF